MMGQPYVLVIISRTAVSCGIRLIQDANSFVPACGAYRAINQDVLILDRR